MDGGCEQERTVRREDFVEAALRAVLTHATFSIDECIVVAEED